MSQNEPCGTPSLPTELLLEIFSQTLTPEHFETIVIQQIPRRRLRLHGPHEGCLIAERARCNLRQVSKLFKLLAGACPGLSSFKKPVGSPVILTSYPEARRVASIDQTNWSLSKLDALSFSPIISGMPDLSAMHLSLDLNSTANFLITTRRLLLPRLVSLSIRIIESSARTRLFLGPRLYILLIYIIKNYTDPTWADFQL